MATLAHRPQVTGGHIIHPQHSFRPSRVSRPLCPTQLLSALSPLHCQKYRRKVADDHRGAKYMSSFEEYMARAKDDSGQ